MAGDGIFKWYWGNGSEPEVFWGGGEDRASAIFAAIDDGCFDDCTSDEELDETIVSIVRADRSVFNAAMPPSMVDTLLEYLEENNEEIWGEDGPEFTGKEILESHLQAAVDKWATVCPPNVWAFADVPEHEELTVRELRREYERLNAAGKESCST